ncbi:MAG: dihydropteroate synthase [Agathobacter sp.]|uniref:dihydropteroate synthase n=1 Tax=Agathobacter sp. TaxID=2021311 RepID=UPI00257BAD0E|nr:dihydropteroate synthase [Agathobacter sp.]MBQ1682363.1 dihydropteroate synthase [Agathobacter sp.]
MKIGKHEFDLKHDCYIMGILNVTPDSFSDGGKWNDIDRALYHVEEMIAEHAAIIDVGGESTRPGYERISDEEEISRVVPVIEAINTRFDIPISIDTYKSRVAEAAVAAGADMLNDIWGFRADEQMAALAARENIPCCLMHNRQEPAVSDFVATMKDDLMKSLEIAKSAGVKDEQIILDPGVGFGKTFEQNLLAVKHLDCLLELGYPVLLATSRKSVVGLALDLPKDQRVEGTVATTVMGVERGACMFRVHDVKENYRAMRMAQAIYNAME